jgi:hypothetical protein
VAVVQAVLHKELAVQAVAVMVDTTTLEFQVLQILVLAVAVDTTEALVQAAQV